MTLPSAAPGNTHHIENIRSALTISDFDSRAAKVTMGMAGRLIDRPADKAGDARVGAVLVLLYPIDGVLHIAYTKRPDTLRSHSGQISFPGGSVDAGETFEQAALREAWEEVGVTAEQVEVIGDMPPLYIMPSDFMVYPFVGFSAERPQFTLNPDEVETLIEAPLPHLLDPATSQVEDRVFPKFNNLMLKTPFYLVDDHKIWGATAIMTGEFLERWKFIRDA